MVYACINFGYNAKYLLNSDSKYYNFLYRILKQEVVKQDEEEDDRAKSLKNMIIDLIKRYFVFFLFLMIKFIEWYYNNNRRRDEIIEKQQYVHVNPPFEQDEQKEMINICPICRKKINLPSCLDVSGYVFCQICIIDYVKKAKKCPITGLDCDLNNIHKIYDQ